jgi:hypothetical protein
MIFSQMKSAKTSIVFIEKTYRRKDPKYADFSIRQQRDILRKLLQEWSNTDCEETPAPPQKKTRR